MSQINSLPCADRLPESRCASKIDGIQSKRGDIKISLIIAFIKMDCAHILWVWCATPVEYNARLHGCGCVVQVTQHRLAESAIRPVMCMEATLM